MIGNDIIDLQQAAQESRIHRKGFLEKLFLPHEIAGIQQAAQPATMVWWLWSCKEAVYKIVHRQTRERRYAPQQFACHLGSLNESAHPGRVIHQQQPYYIQSTITAAYIHTHAAITPPLLEQTAVFTSQQSTGYASLLQEILSGEELFYKDEDGIPCIRCRESNKQLPVSISHHGNYLGIVKMKSN